METFKVTVKAAFTLIICFFYTSCSQNSEEAPEPVNLQNLAKILEQNDLTGQISYEKDTLYIYLSLSGLDFISFEKSKLIQEMAIIYVYDEIKSVGTLAIVNEVPTAPEEKLVQYYDSIQRRNIKQFNSDPLVFRFNKHILDNIEGTELEYLNSGLRVFKQDTGDPEIPESFTALVYKYAEACRGNNQEGNSFNYNGLFNILKELMFMRVKGGDKYAANFKASDIDYFIDNCR